MLALPGCWRLYTSLEDWKSALHHEHALTTVQQLVDTYAVQHATNPDRRNRQSVAGHLMSLCACFERGIPGVRLRTMIGGWLDREYPMLLPRPESFPITIVNVVSTPERTRPDAVAEWATTTWSAWSAHHDQVRTWLAEARSGVR
jgi:hypothetical protein